MLMKRAGLSAKRAERAVFKAVSDPTRRAILDILSVREQTVRELTESFAISQPAISQHLRELREARLVRATKFQQQRRYRLTPEPLAFVLRWSGNYRRFFDPAGHAWAFVDASAAAGTEPRKDSDGPQRGRRRSKADGN